MSDITAPTPNLFPEATSATDTEALFARVEALRPTLKENFRDEIVKSLYAEAESMARRSVRVQGDKSYDLDQRIDRIVTSPIFGLPTCAHVGGGLLGHHRRRQHSIENPGRGPVLDRREGRGAIHRTWFAPRFGRTDAATTVIFFSIFTILEDLTTTRLQLEFFTRAAHNSPSAWP
jgi:hypothetical protein